MEGQPSDPGDRDVQISISRAEEIRFWCNRFGCTAAELGNAIGQVGYSAERVRVLLASSGKIESHEGRWPPWPDR
jgi:hypothetical protein